MRAGIEPADANMMTWSSFYQTFSIPANATSVTLRVWWYRQTEETTTSVLTSAGQPSEGDGLSILPYTEDLQELLLLNGYNLSLVAELDRSRVNQGTWVQETYDLSPWRGWTLALYFNAYNDGVGGRTWMYVDDVSLQICVPAS